MNTFRIFCATRKCLLAASIIKLPRIEMSTSAKLIELDELIVSHIRERFPKDGGRVTLEKNEKLGIAFVCIDNAKGQNCLGGNMLADLHKTLSSLETWNSGKGLILHSTGSAFSNGGYNLNQLTKLDWCRMTVLMHNFVTRIRRLPLVSVALVQGKASGTGTELLLSTDFRILTKNAEIHFDQAKLGVGPAWGGGTLLKQIVGHQKCLQLFLTNGKISSTEAVQLGLADKLVEEENSLESVTNWMSTLMEQHDASIVQALKRIVYYGNLEDERRILDSTIHDQPHLNAMGINLENLFASKDDLSSRYVF